MAAIMVRAIDPLFTLSACHVTGLVSAPNLSLTFLVFLQVGGGRKVAQLLRMRIIRQSFGCRSVFMRNLLVQRCV